MSAIMLIEFDDEYEYDVNFDVVVNDVSMHLHPIVETDEDVVENTEKVTTCFGKFYRLFFKQ